MFPFGGPIFHMKNWSLTRKIKDPKNKPPTSFWLHGACHTKCDVQKLKCENEGIITCQQRPDN